MRGLASEIQEDLITMVSHLDDEAKKELFNLYREKTEGKQRSPELLLSFLKYLVKKDFSWFTRIFIQCSEGQEFDFALHAQILCEVCQQHSADNLKYDNDVLINIPPGHSKTLICNVLYSAWLLGNHPAMRILVRTNNDTMAVKTNNNTALIMTSKAYKEVFGNIVVNLTNNQIKTFDGKAYGYRSSTAIGTRVTGESAELIICFPYSQDVLTDKGILKIGDIVEKKIKCKVKSWDNDNNKFVWSDITRYIKNESDTGFDMVEVEMEDGTKIQCTKDHKFLTKNRGMVEAQYLTSEDDVLEYR